MRDGESLTPSGKGNPRDRCSLVERDGPVRVRLLGRCQRRRTVDPVGERVVPGLAPAKHDVALLAGQRVEVPQLSPLASGEHDPGQCSGRTALYAARAASQSTPELPVVRVATWRPTTQPSSIAITAPCAMYCRGVRRVAEQGDPPVRPVHDRVAVEHPPPAVPLHQGVPSCIEGSRGGLYLVPTTCRARTALHHYRDATSSRGPFPGIASNRPPTRCPLLPSEGAAFPGRPDQPALVTRGTSRRSRNSSIEMPKVAITVTASRPGPTSKTAWSV